MIINAPIILPLIQPTISICGDESPINGGSLIKTGSYRCKSRHCIAQKHQYKYLEKTKKH